MRGLDPGYGYDEMLIKNDPVCGDPGRPVNAIALERRGVQALFLTHTGQIGGAEVCLLTIAGGVPGNVLLFEDGPLRYRLQAIDVSVALPRVSLDLREVHRDRGLLKVLPVAARIIALMRQIRRQATSHDIVYCNSQKSFAIGAVASMLHRAPLLWHLHDILDKTHFGRVQIYLMIWLANHRARAVVAPSQAVADAFEAAGGRSGLIRVIPNGVHAPPPETACEERALLRRRLDLPGGRLFGVFSRLSRWKGQHVALEALASLPDTKCIIVGKALFGEEEYAASLRAQVERLDLTDRVHFLGHREDVGLLMQAVDVVVHPSVDPEPFGLTLVEAMFAGTPVIASRSGAAPEILDRGRCGTLVPPGDAGALAAALSRALDRAESAPETGLHETIAARHRARTHYSANRLIEDIRALTSELAGSPVHRHELVAALEGFP